MGVLPRKIMRQRRLLQGVSRTINCDTVNTIFKSIYFALLQSTEVTSRSNIVQGYTKI